MRADASSSSVNAARTMKRSAMTKEFKSTGPLHPESQQLAPALAAPLIGALIIGWTELERDMNRFVLTKRLSRKDDSRLDRKLSLHFKDNLNEWLIGYITDVGRREYFRREALALLNIRNCLVHNIWTIHLTNELNIVVNFVRENWKYMNEEECRSATLEQFPSRIVQKPAPVSFETSSITGSELGLAIDRIKTLYLQMLQSICP